jgi:hypothetical protein
MISFANSSMASFGSSVLPKIGVTIGPGATELTRMPRPDSSAAVVRAKERSAALVADYALVPAVDAWCAFTVISPSAHRDQPLRIPSPFDPNVRGGTFDGTEIFRGKVDVRRFEVFFKAMQLGCARNRNDPRLLGK